MFAHLSGKEAGLRKRAGILQNRDFTAQLSRRERFMEGCNLGFGWVFLWFSAQAGALRVPPDSLQQVFSFIQLLMPMILILYAVAI